MKLSKLAALALVALLVSAGAAAAVPGVASNQNQADGHAQATDHADDGDAHASSGGAANAPDDRGPHVDLPEQVPDHVEQIHELIRRFLSGDLDGSLGGAVSDATPGNSTETPADASG